jgi:hypothetical protein
MKILMIHLWYDRYGLIFIKIYKVYFDDDYADNNTINNDSNGYYDVINNILIDKVELIAKMTLKALDIVFCWFGIFWSSWLQAYYHHENSKVISI